jgi:hypothetical protein
MKDLKTGLNRPLVVYIKSRLNLIKYLNQTTNVQKIQGHSNMLNSISKNSYCGLWVWLK